jgi:hypothetical protein
MGTSAAAGSISGNHPLIPQWIADEPPADVVADDPPTDDNQGRDRENGPVNSAQRFSNARSSMTSAIRLASTGRLVGGSRDGTSRGGGGRGQTPRHRVRKAVAQYVAARGGPARVASRLGVALNVGARLYQVLDRVARDGLDAALQALGIVVDANSAGAVADALMTLVCADAAAGLEGLLDESLARVACDETFIELYQNNKRLSELTPQDVPDVVRSFATNAATMLITREIGASLIDRPRTEEESRTLRSTLRSVIESSIRLELPGGTSDNYTVSDVREAINVAYHDAFRILGAGRER